MISMVSQITSLTIGFSTVYSDADQRKHQSSVSLVFVRGIHRWPVDSPHKRPVTRNMFPFDDVIMEYYYLTSFWRDIYVISLLSPTWMRSLPSSRDPPSAAGRKFCLPPPRATCGNVHYRLLHGLSLLAAGLSVGYETWPPVSWLLLP